MATDFAKIIDKKGGGSVAVGEFSGSSKVKGSVGPRLQIVLKAELEKLKIRIDLVTFVSKSKGTINQ